MAVYGYVRATARKSDLSPADQRERIRQFCEFHDLGAAAVFEDPAMSSSKDLNEREAGRALMARVRRGDTIVCTRLDRMFSRIDDVVAVYGQLQRLGVAMYFTELGPDPFDVRLGTLVALAGLRPRLISERTIEALNKRAKSGLHITGSPRYGFSLEPRIVGGKRINVLVPNHEERAVMARIFQLRAGSDPPLQWREIAKILDKEGVKQPRSNGDRGARNWNINKVRRCFYREMAVRLAQGDAAAVAAKAGMRMRRPKRTLEERLSFYDDNDRRGNGGRAREL